VILIGLGANLTNPTFGSPRETLEAALLALSKEGIRVRQRSNWYRSAPVPVSSQPWFVNAVAEVETELPPGALLAVLHRIEADFGRVRTERNEARVIDLDLLAFQDTLSQPGEPLELPHPRLAERAFVLLPLREIAPDWVHPRLNRPISALCQELPSDQVCEFMD